MSSFPDVVSPLSESLAPGSERLSSPPLSCRVGTAGDNVRFRLAPSGRLNIECPERSDCCQVI